MSSVDESWVEFANRTCRGGGGEFQAHTQWPFIVEYRQCEGVKEYRTTHRYAVRKETKWITISWMEKELGVGLR